MTGVESPALRRLALAHVPGRDEPRIEPLRGGSLNHSFKITRDAGDYVLRVDAGTGGTAPAPGVDRAWECRVLRAAAQAGIAPAVVVCDPRAGILVTRWVDGAEWSTEQAAAAASQVRVAALVSRVHALTVAEPARRMSVRAWRDLYREQFARSSRGESTAASLAHADARADELLSQYEALPGVHPCLCHSDLHRQNVLWNDHDGWLLDWEYAHVGDPFWDLAGWACANALGSAARDELLDTYLQRAAAPAEHERLALLMRLYETICEWWAALAAAQPPRAP